MILVNLSIVISSSVINWREHSSIIIYVIIPILLVFAMQIYSQFAYVEFITGIVHVFDYRFMCSFALPFIIIIYDHIIWHNLFAHYDFILKQLYKLDLIFLYYFLILISIILLIVFSLFIIILFRLLYDRSKTIIHLFGLK